MDELDQPEILICGKKELVVCGGDVAEAPKEGIFEIVPLGRSRWYLEVPYRHLTYGWPVLHKVRLRRD